MILKYAPNKIAKTTAEINLEWVISTLIGENWSWKSTILETIFNNYADDDIRIIVYSSWLNESYSKINEAIIKKANKFTLRRLDEEWDDKSFLNSMYFNKDWAKLLIFLAVWLENWSTVNFINSKLWSSPEIKFTYLLNNETYKFYYNEWLKKELNWEYSIIKTTFHRLLSWFLWASWLAKIDFTKNLKNKSLEIEHNDLLSIFTFSQEYENDEWLVDKYTTEEYKLARSNYLLTFIWIFKEYFIKLEESNLFINKIELNDLSDWEFQLLTIYSLIDLFDDKNTVFLFDEIDSHLHYTNINRLWGFLNWISWKILTTTHIPDSIVNNSVKNIFPVHDWIIKKELASDYILERVGNLSQIDSYTKKLALWIKYIVLVEDKTDWVIFTELLKIKIWEKLVTEFMSKLDYIKCSSGYDKHTQKFADNKKQWVEDFKKVIYKNNVKTEAIFFLCDRDNLPLSSINSTNNVKVDWETITFWNNKKVHILSWRRKQIENYLLSYTLLNSQWILENINDELWRSSMIQSWKTNDNLWVQNLEIKDDIKILYCDCNWVDYEKLKSIIKTTPKDEISDDIENMYNYISDKL